MTETQKDIMRGDGYVLATDAADAIGVTPVTIYRLVDDEKVRGQKAGGTRYVNLKDLVELYDQAPTIQKRIEAL